MTLEKALEAFKSLYEDIDKENRLFVGTMNPDMIKIAIDAIDYKIKTKDLTILTEEEPNNTFECLFLEEDPDDNTFSCYLKPLAKDKCNGLFKEECKIYRKCKYNDSNPRT